MKAIQDIEIIYNQEADWQPYHVAFIKTVSLVENSLVIDVLSQKRKNTAEWPDRLNGFLEIKILFKKVSKLKINFTNIPYQAVMGFDIKDLSNNNGKTLALKYKTTRTILSSFTAKA